jgi:hypothetical protein
MSFDNYLPYLFYFLLIGSFVYWIVLPGCKRRKERKRQERMAFEEGEKRRQENEEREKIREKAKSDITNKRLSAYLKRKEATGSGLWITGTGKEATGSGLRITGTGTGYGIRCQSHNSKTTQENDEEEIA